MTRFCANVKRRRDGRKAGGCLACVRWYCPACDAYRCAIHSPRGVCGTCGKPAVQAVDVGEGRG